MSQNTYRESVIKLARQIKKEHFLKTFLWTAGIVLTLLWLSMLIATSISSGERLILEENEKNFTKVNLTEQNLSLINEYLNDSWFKTRLSVIDNNFVLVAIPILDKLDWNPLCLTYDPTLSGWFVCVVLAPIGYLGIIFIIAYLKNMITPQQVKKTVRKALQFGYLKQKDVDYVVDEIDYNIGIKERKTNEEKTNNQNLQLQ